MRALSIIFWILSVLAALAGMVFYGYVQAMGCAFSGPAGSQNCTHKWPWEMGQEDFVFLVLLPSLAVLLLIFLAIRTGKAATVRDRQKHSMTKQGSDDA